MQSNCLYEAAIVENSVKNPTIEIQYQYIKYILYIIDKQVEIRQKGRDCYS
ncbi:hypothetical protein LEP1GSC058_1370 [Leptospira fainei serovar Hurstbridge str. BUT 6]|uniref:Uncharacterized protein n=1 Tax=Leptospira fainei serovar Hurstbridge str. BUT 6 TaxID=1193011 RepID=S3W8G5_9LEPT|nr:hypothetical protein LEP1GSC058_1370 [Leptospira fainei serovar Hurstbridge str. BUT 6]